MCGIAGSISFTTQFGVDLRGMTDLIRHRGPDDEGYVLFPQLASEPVVYWGKDTPENVLAMNSAYAPTSRLEAGEHKMALALGHRRLSVVDLSPLGHQPMCTPDKRYWIVYNGEVYNHIELRLELEQLGHVFRSHSDTEVILAAYAQWGADCLSYFNGMFAFLIHDRLTSTLFAARDRFGVKPLYYRVSQNGIAFASEIKQFTVLSDWQAQVNGQRAYDFLNWGISDHTDETLFSGVYQLRGGHAIELPLQKLLANEVHSGSRLPVYQWYQLKPRAFSGTIQSASEQFRELLEDSVRLRLRADVSVGSCLSGGLDSSSIVCIANRLLRAENVQHLQKTFSACSDVARFDEREWIDIVVDATGVDAHYVYPSFSTLFSEASKIIWHQDEPFGSTSIYAQWHVFKMAAEQNTKVMLDGQGADEQLAGYHGFFGPHLASLFKAMRWGQLLSEASAMHSVHGYSYLTATAYLSNYLLPEWIKDPLRKAIGRASLVPKWLDMTLLNCSPLNPLQTVGASQAKTVQALSAAQLTASNLQMLLHWEDRDSMAHSVESRVPFLDYRLVEFVLGLPDEFKLYNAVTKRVLREGMRDMLPERIRTRMDKLGFVTPEEVWLRESGTPQFRSALNEAIDASRGILNNHAVTELNDMVLARKPFNFMIWRMISFGLWMKNFNVTVKT
ncbi:MAG: asparagine synthase (glutamine-hydrolyzing) [Gammaproteobacteria bacterium]